MKRIVVILLAGSMLLFAACADKTGEEPQTQTPQPAASPETDQQSAGETAAEQTTPEAPFETKRIEPGESCGCDLNGDGKLETISILEEDGADEYEKVYTLCVVSEDGKQALRQSELFSYRAYALISDLDASDEMKEVFFCETYASDDYETHCFRYDGNGLSELSFVNAGGENTNSFYGNVEEAENGIIKMKSVIDILGTRYGTREFLLQNGLIAPVRDSMWSFDEPEVWEEYLTLTLAKPMPATFEGAERVLEKGEKIFITATDYESFVEFVTEAGERGRVAVEPNTAEWGYLIAGEPEQDYFEDMLPYAG